MFRGLLMIMMIMMNHSVCQKDSCELWQHTSSVLDLTFDRSAAGRRADDGQTSAAPWTFDLDRVELYVGVFFCVCLQTCRNMMK